MCGGGNVRERRKMGLERRLGEMGGRQKGKSVTKEERVRDRVGSGNGAGV